MLQNRTLFWLLLVSVTIAGLGFITYQRYQKNSDTTTIHFDSLAKQNIQNCCRNSNKLESKLYKRKHKRDPVFDKHQILPLRNDINIDIVVPVIERDLEVLEHGIVAARKLIGHNVNKIFLVAPPNSEKVKAFGKKYNCIVLDENKVIPSPEIKKYGGWIIQQFIKLNADTFVEQPHYLVFDADTIFIRPNLFIATDNHEQDDYYIINVHSTCHAPRKVLAAKWLGNSTIYTYDFVPHHMLFSTKIMQQLKQHISQRHNNKPWYQVMLDEFAANDNARELSEYELYTIFLTEFSNAKYSFVSSANIGVNRSKLAALNELKAAYANDYKSLSFHHLP